VETTEQRKERYIQTILKAHPFYLPETHVAQQAAKSMRRMPEQTLFYLWHLLGDNEKHPERKTE